MQYQSPLRKTTEPINNKIVLQGLNKPLSIDPVTIRDKATEPI